MAFSAALLQQSRVEILIRRVDLGVESSATVTPPPSLGLRQGISGCTRLSASDGIRGGGMRRQAGRIGQEDQRQGLGYLFGEGVVEHQRVVAPLIERYIEGTLRNLVRLAFPCPFDGLQTNPGQLLDYGGLLLSRAGRGCGCGEILGGIGALGIGGRDLRTQSRRLSGVFEDAEVDRLLVRLNTPRDGVVGVDIDPTNKIRLPGN